MFTWEGSIKGPKDTMWEGEIIVFKTTNCPHVKLTSM